MNTPSSRHVLPLARRVLILLGLVAWVFPVLAQDALLDDARSRLAAGDAVGAYALLSPAEEERAGEPDFDYLLGIAALDSGQATLAVFALERVVSVQPDNVLARAELARAYTTLREFESARDELNIVRSSSVPDEAKAQVVRYLDAVEGVMSKNNKVMVDVKGGNNMMYLPLDKLTTPSTSTGAVRKLTIDSSNIRELTNAVTEQLRNDAAAAGNRRGGR